MQQTVFFNWETNTGKEGVSGRFWEADGIIISGVAAETTSGNGKDVFLASPLSVNVFKRFGILNPAGENILVPPHRICSIEANNKHSRFYYYDVIAGKYRSAGSHESFGKVSERLPAELFIQCHRSWIVNPWFVTNIIPNKKKGGVLLCGHPPCQSIPYTDNFKPALARYFNVCQM